VIFVLKKLISALEDMKIKKNTFSTLILDLFFPSIANYRKLKIQKSTSPTVYDIDVGQYVRLSCTAITPEEFHSLTHGYWLSADKSTTVS
jgi:hypothetical protein